LLEGLHLVGEEVLLLVVEADQFKPHLRAADFGMKLVAPIRDDGEIA
jgi:hypothetical protein